MALETIKTIGAVLSVITAIAGGVYAYHNMDHMMDRTTAKKTNARVTGMVIQSMIEPYCEGKLDTELEQHLYSLMDDFKQSAGREYRYQCPE